MKKALCCMFGTHAAEFIAVGPFGRMVGWQGTQKISDVNISAAVGRLKGFRPMATCPHRPGVGSFARSLTALEGSPAPDYRP